MGKRCQFSARTNASEELQRTCTMEDVKGYLKMVGLKGKITIRACYVGEVGNEYCSKMTWSERLRRNREGRELTILLDDLPEPDPESPSRWQRFKALFGGRKKEG